MYMLNIVSAIDMTIIEPRDFIMKIIIVKLHLSKKTVIIQ